MGAYKIVRSPKTLLKLCRAYFDGIRYEEPQDRLVQTGVSNKGKPIYAREPILRTDEDGREIQMTVTRWIRPPTLEALCNTIPISMDTWERYAKLDGYAEVCAWAKAVCKEALLERGLDGSVNAQMAQFVLKNGYGMKDEMTVHNTGTVEDYLDTLEGEQEM